MNKTLARRIAEAVTRQTYCMTPDDDMFSVLADGVEEVVNEELPPGAEAASELLAITERLRRHIGPQEATKESVQLCRDADAVIAKAKGTAP